MLIKKLEIQGSYTNLNQNSFKDGRGDAVIHPLKRMFASMSRQPVLSLSSSLVCLIDG